MLGQEKGMIRWPVSVPLKGGTNLSKGLYSVQMMLSHLERKQLPLLTGLNGCFRN